MMLRLSDSSTRSRQVSRAGFSLVELLVSIAIFVILATLALSAFRDSKHDKVASASRQIYAAIGGARSRAAKSNEPRGVRLLRDKQDYRLISGLQYVGESQLYDGTLRVQINNTGGVQLKTTSSGEWAILRNEGLLKPGSQIYLWNWPQYATPPLNVNNSSGGRWYTIATPGFDPDNDKMRIVGLIDGAQWNAAANSGSGAYQSYPQAGADASELSFSNTTSVPYLLRLSPQELPDAEAIKLPSGMVIDMLSSHIPPFWYIKEDANQNGVLDSGEDVNGNGFLDLVIEDWNQNGVLDGTEDMIAPSTRTGYNNGVLDDVNFDLPVSPNGTITGAVSGNGPIYLYLCHRDDVDRMRAMTGYVAGLIPGDFENGTAAPYGPDHPSSERKVVCIIPQTGLVYIAPVNGADSNNDGWADDPFSFARAGREDR